MKHLLSCLVTVCIAVIPAVTRAQRPVTDECIIRTFTSAITVQTDSALDINETITVDCGTLADKHGIFRILPTQAATPQRRTPVTLASITDETGKSYHYERISDWIDKTETWKIGDPDVTITGLHIYNLRYRVDNAVALTASGTELYWNLNGNFWELPIESYRAIITFPDGITSATTQPTIYSGTSGTTSNTSASVMWTEPRTITVTSLRPLEAKEGITIKASLPNSIFTPYTDRILDRKPIVLGIWTGFVLVILIIGYTIWRRYRRDQRVDKTEVVEFAPPHNLRPLELGMVETYGTIRPSHIAATIVDLAVRGYLTIEAIPKQGIIGNADWRITQTTKPTKELKSFEQRIVRELFSRTEPNKKTTLLSLHDDTFYQSLPKVEQQAMQELKPLNLFPPEKNATNTLLTILLILVIILSTSAILYLQELHNSIIISTALVGGVLIYLMAMPRRTPEGAELNYKIQGFKLYIQKAETYRSQFNERENIFDRFLPYAIVFGVTKQWIQAMERIRGTEALATYHPAWYVGATRSFDANSFSSHIASLSSAIGQASSSPSSSSGSSGGGGGGGGGGSW